MKTRSEIHEMAMEGHKRTLAKIEVDISRAIQRNDSTVVYYCAQAEYFELRREIERSGFRTEWIENKHHIVFPSKMVIFV